MYVWRGIKTIPRPHEFYRAETVPLVLKFLDNLLSNKHMIPQTPNALHIAFKPLSLSISPSLSLSLCVCVGVCVCVCSYIAYPITLIKIKIIRHQFDAECKHFNCGNIIVERTWCVLCICLSYVHFKKKII